MACAEGQPDSIVQDIDNMVRSYVEKVCVNLLSLKLAEISGMIYLMLMPNLITKLQEYAFKF